MEGSSFWRRSRRGGGGGAPLAALLVLLLPAFFPGLFTPLGQASPSVFSEWNAPKPRHLRLLEGALNSRIADRDSLDLWSPLPPQGWKPCTGPRSTSGLPKRSRGYIQVFLDGGLNQQRMGICDAVAVAKILNATLVIPFLEVNPVWKDSSTFTDIFDVDHFIDVLKDEITIVRDLPEEYSWSTREYYALGIRPTRIKMAPVHASANWYLENVLPVLRKYGIAAIAPFSHRLAFDNLPEEIQRLRCKVNFQALAFVPHITELGDTLIGRLRRPIRLDSDVDAVSINKASHSIVDRSEGKFVALHLRFDKDMAAHSACDFGGGKAEMLALAKYRQVVWQGRVLNSQFTDEELRAQGRCPLTPEEIGLMLAAMGFDRNTRLYLASHKVYGGEARLSALRQLFPLMEDKKSLASKEELARVKGKASLLAALDYYVSMHSDVFISASPGNMHNLMVGHRTYENSKSIRPNMVLLGQLFLNKTIGWGEFEQAVKAGHSNRQGQIRLRKEKQSIYTSAFGSAFAKSKIGKSRFQRARWERGAFWPRGAHLPRRPCTTRELSSSPVHDARTLLASVAYLFRTVVSSKIGEKRVGVRFSRRAGMCRYLSSLPILPRTEAEEEAASLGNAARLQARLQRGIGSYRVSKRSLKRSHHFFFRGPASGEKGLHGWSRLLPQQILRALSLLSTCSVSLSISRTNIYRTKPPPHMGVFSQSRAWWKH